MISPATGRALVARPARYLGALALLGVGAEHLDQFAADSYSAIPTIGTLFALNFAAATVVALGLAVPSRRIARGRAEAALTALAVAGIAIAAGSLAALLASERGGLFGFMEQGYRGAIVLSIVLELATMLLLGLFLAAGGPRAQAPAGAASRRRSQSLKPPSVDVTSRSRTSTIRSAMRSRR